jgi:lipopolysaccharide transport system ATP-binding protein
MTSGARPAIVVKDVRKEFLIPHERRVTLFENIAGAFRHSTYERFVALDDINLTIRRGESVGIIGDNGCGKSTLLKIMSDILRPTHGSVKVYGRITPFLELGVGFQPDLTANENIEVYSTIMGLSDRDIARNMSSVLEFAGLTNFRDTKLKNFSSGMQVRLAFATAIQVVPDIMLIDEVLAVGDMDFQQKCLEVFADYKRMGVTMVFVSHDLGAVRRFCDRTVFMKHGRILADGRTPEVIDRYVYGLDKLDQNSQSAVVTGSASADAAKEEIGAADATNGGEIKTDPVPVPAQSEKKARWGNGKITITRVQILDKYGNESAMFHTGDMLAINIIFRAPEPVDDPVFGIAVYNEEGLLCYGSNTDIARLAMGMVSGEGEIEVKVPRLSFISGKYLLTVAAHAKDNIPYDWHDKLYSFRVINTGNVIGLVDLNCEWAGEGGKRT